MQGLLRRYKRWRHGRGFGIHSPFAFRFITEVLRQKHPYYGYADISRDERVRLLFRLVVALRPETVRVMADCGTLFTKAATRACSATVQTETGIADLLIVDDLDTTPEAYLDMLAQGRTHALIVNADDKLVKRLSETLPHGMIFDNCRGTIVITAYSHLPRQDFEVKF